MRCSVIAVCLALLAVGASAQTCTTYCADLMSVCPTQYLNYFQIGQFAPGGAVDTTAAQTAACMFQCGAWPAGAATDSAVNSFGCRATYLAAAKAGTGGSTAVAANCVHASPNTDMCGNYIENFYNLTNTVCTGANQQYTSYQDAWNQLQNIPQTDNSGNPLNNSAQIDNIQCREYHTLFASTSATAAAAHCVHGARVSGTCNSGTNGYFGLPFGDGYCDAYCDDYSAKCYSDPTYTIPSLAASGTFAQRKGACMILCKTFATGDMNNNGSTQTCRAYHAYAAGVIGTAAVHCPHAGLGAGVCGGTCDFYCQVFTATCTAATAPFPTDPYPGGLQECLTDCRGFMPQPNPLETMADAASALATFETAIGSVPPTWTPASSDDSTVCRAYHSTAAALVGLPHCSHANKYGGAYPTPGPCGSALLTYVDADVSYCCPSATQCAINIPVAGMTAGTAAYFEGLPYPTPAPSTTTTPTSGGDSLACRQYHLEAAGAAGAAGNAALATSHCAHAQIISTIAPYTNGPCSNAGDAYGCDYFCDLDTLVCPGVYASQAACITACNAYNPGTMPPGTDQGPQDTFSCRFYHLTVAASGTLTNNTALTALHCPHSGQTSAVCNVVQNTTMPSSTGMPPVIKAGGAGSIVVGAATAVLLLAALVL